MSLKRDKIEVKWESIEVMNVMLCGRLPMPLIIYYKSFTSNIIRNRRERGEKEVKMEKMVRKMKRFVIKSKYFLYPMKNTNSYMIS